MEQQIIFNIITVIWLLLYAQIQLPEYQDNYLSIEDIHRISVRCAMEIAIEDIKMVITVIRQWHNEFFLAVENYKTSDPINFPERFRIAAIGRTIDIVQQK